MQKLFNKLSMLTLLTAIVMTGCSKPEQVDEKPLSPASVAEAQAVPMSASPADDKTVPVVVSDNASAVATTTASGTNGSVTDNPQEVEVSAEEVDNSEMEKITEDAQVIDDEPASPDAPKDPTVSQDNGNAKISN